MNRPAARIVSRIRISRLSYAEKKTAGRSSGSFAVAVLGNSTLLHSNDGHFIRRIIAGERVGFAAENEPLKDKHLSPEGRRL